MAQAQLDARIKPNTFFVDILGELTVKVWKKGREGCYVTLKKPGTTQSLTLPLQVCRNLLESADVIVLASDFIRGLVGVSPADLADPSADNY